MVTTDASAVRSPSTQSREETMMEAQDDLDPATALTPPGAKRLSLTQPDRSMGGPISTQLGIPKNKWRITTKVTTRILILTDEILDQTGQIPADWELHIFPKAYLADIVSVIDKLEPSGGLRKTVVTVGWHNKDRATENILRDINAVINAAKKKGLELHFLGFSSVCKISVRVFFVERDKMAWNPATYASPT